MKVFVFLIFLSLTFSSCQFFEPKAETQEQGLDLTKIPKFNKDLAYQYIEKQVSFGPRVPSMASHQVCAEWILSVLKASADTAYFQEFETKTYDQKIHKGKNIIAKINPQNPVRIMLSAHWDTRPVADQDPKDPKKPILGANDGASGVGVILALLESFKEKKPAIGIDIVLFDIEDYGQPENSGFPEMQDSYCLGSQYWSKNKTNDFPIRYGVLLDMVGGFNASFYKEGTSMMFAPNLVHRIWGIASDMGYSSYFKSQVGPAITDDHSYVNSIGQIPMIDIIHLNKEGESAFAHYWHTHKDDMSSVDKNALDAVGNVLLYWIFDEN
jgi:glutaminyl-peptide cyclotransferase